MYENAPKNSEDPSPEPFQPKYLPFVNISQERDNIADDNDSFEDDCEERDSIVTEPGAIYQASAAYRQPAYQQSVYQQAGPHFYSETILSKKDSDRSFFRLSRFAIAVSLFFIFGVLLMGVGVALLISFSAQDHYAEGAITARITRDIPLAELPADQQAQDSAPARQFRLDNASVGDRQSFRSDYIASALTVSNHIVQLVTYIEPSVAAISTTGTVTDIFAGLRPGQPNTAPPAHIERSMRGSGSGILFAEDDERIYIVTNAHVIEQASSVSVSVLDSEPVPARLVGIDHDEDLAVISIMKDDFEEAGLTKWSLARFGDSDHMQVGEMVIAVGNAMGGGNTVTNGVISGREQQIVVDGRPYTVLQTNAAINPGNSGGPLVNMDGEVIGINTAKISTAYNVEGMGYSITANVAVPIIEHFMNNIPNRAFLGIEGRTIPREIAEAFGLPELGVFVHSVFTGSPAQVAGIEQGDIIASIDGEPVVSMEALVEMISRRNVGDTISLRIIRDGVEFLTLSAVLERLIDTSFN